MSCAKARWRRLFQGEGTAYGKFKNLKLQINAGEASSGSGVHEQK